MIPETLKVLIVFVLFALFAWLLHAIKRKGLDRVLIKRRERPHRLIGSEVRIFAVERGDTEDVPRPLARVASHDGEHYLLQFEQPWTGPLGELRELRVRSAAEGNPLSKLRGQRSGSIEVVTVLTDGSTEKLELEVVSLPVRRKELLVLSAMAVSAILYGGFDLYRNARLHVDRQQIDARIESRRESRRRQTVCYEFFVPERSKFYGPDSWRGGEGGCVRVDEEMYRRAGRDVYMPVYYSPGSPWLNRPTLPTWRDYAASALLIVFGFFGARWSLTGLRRRSEPALN